MHPDWYAASIWKLLSAYLYTKITVEKFLMWAWNWNWCLCTIQWIFLMVKYCWCSSFDEPIHNGSTCVEMILIHCGGQRRFQVIHDKNIWGGVPSQISLCCALGEILLVPYLSLALSLLLYLWTLTLSMVLGVRSWKQYNLDPLPFLFS